MFRCMYMSRGNHVVDPLIMKPIERLLLLFIEKGNTLGIVF